MAGLQIVKQRGHIDLVVNLEGRIAVDGEIDHGQKGVGVYTVEAARLVDGLVAKAHINAKRAQGLQHTVVVFNQCHHLVGGLVHLQVLHIRRGLSFLERHCKSKHFPRHGQAL